MKRIAQLCAVLLSLTGCVSNRDIAWAPFYPIAALGDALESGRAARRSAAQDAAQDQLNNERQAYRQAAQPEGASLETLRQCVLRCGYVFEQLPRAFEEQRVRNYADFALQYDAARRLVARVGASPAPDDVLALMVAQTVLSLDGSSGSWRADTSRAPALRAILQRPDFITLYARSDWFRDAQGIHTLQSLVGNARETAEVVVLYAAVQRRGAAAATAFFQNCKAEYTALFGPRAHDAYTACHAAYFLHYQRTVSQPISALWLRGA